jgi:riboflavin synthase
MGFSATRSAHTMALEPALGKGVMFTGIIESIGEIRDLVSTGEGLRIRVAPGALELEEVKMGDSVAVDGACLTVSALSQATFSADVSQETLNCTTGFAQGRRVNLEMALKLSDRLGGHLLSGHVDGVGEVMRVDPVDANRRMIIRAPSGLARYLARKGSIAVNGVSLTINEVERETFSVNLIPHTLNSTNLKGLSAGSRVNLEVDMLARYLEVLLDPSYGR